jgi:hypothetical protein
MHIMEDVGVTITGIVPHYEGIKVVPCALRDMFMEPDIAAGFLFCAVHALHSMHQRTGMAQNDLHANNMTLQVMRSAISIWGLCTKDGKSVHLGTGCRDPLAVYLIDGSQDNAFVFPTRLVHPKIIDYSRAIFNNTANIEVSERFWDEQHDRIVSSFKRYVEVTDDTVKAIESPDSEEWTFSAVTMIDFLAAAKTVRVMASQFEALESVSRLCDELESSAHDTLRHIVSSRKQVDPKPMFRKLFAKYLWNVESHGTKGTVLECYNASGKMPYSTGDTDRLPPWFDVSRFETEGNPFIKYVGEDATRVRQENHVPIVAEQVSADLNRERLKNKHEILQGV